MEKAPSVPLVPQHLGSKSDFDDIEDLIERNKCAKEYYKLEDCLAEYDRNWSKCQDVVKLLRQCNDRLNKK
ncbi:hypothetical protein THRCLA_21096 [Thraustotheca clavata]|uniref:CHCH domain-containing protein n=1 Tax=Thraustotheca clavata TaxID=74557 RepID=A0A1W0A0B5_9STRA|nr:hypothetical protein THRCLA_21096 [Thraustotheca clavata]